MVRSEYFYLIQNELLIYWFVKLDGNLIKKNKTCIFKNKDFFLLIIIIMSC